jgi:hypothetical protein
MKTVIMLRIVFFIFFLTLFGEETRAQDSTEFSTLYPRRDYPGTEKIKEAEPERKT